MKKEKALLMALKIRDCCDKHGDDCTQCPFFIQGCIVTDGDSIPADWRIGQMIDQSGRIIEDD